jgi:hypothetical protein
MDEIDQSLSHALDRIEEFRALQSDRPDEERLEAVPLPCYIKYVL